MAPLLSKARNKWHYYLAARKALRPKFTADDLQRAGYYSQHGQDKWVAETLFPGKRNGVFVDIGAHDGVTLSNTAYLERTLGWTGLAIEPIPKIYQQLRENRQCITVQGCVADRPAKLSFQMIMGSSEMLSGLVDDYDVRHRARIKRELSERGGESQEIEVQCYRLNDLLDAHEMPLVDYLSIDTEGSERAILKSIDWNRFAISVVGVENNYCDSRFAALLEDHGYQFHSRLGCDDFYVRLR